MRKTIAIVAGVLVVLLVAAVALSPWAYKTYVEGPPDPTLALSTETRPASTGIDGAWVVQPGGAAGYRVQQELFWQLVDVTGRTDAVTGRVDVVESRLQSAEFTVDVASFDSGRPGRDERFRSTDALDTATFPTATLVVNTPLDLSVLPDDGSPVALDIPGHLTLHGISQPAVAATEIRRNGDRVDIAGTIVVRFYDFNVDPPRPFASLLEVQPVATIEFLVQLAKR